MFARRVHMHLKPNSVAEFTQKLEKDILPLLRKQQGFQDEITFVSHDGREGFGISLWDKRENAEAYNRNSKDSRTKSRSSAMTAGKGSESVCGTKGRMPRLTTVELTQK